MSYVDIRLKRVDRVYRPGETVEGVVIINATSAWAHQGISMRVEGSVKLQLSARSVGLFESFYANLAPVVLMTEEIEILEPGRVPEGLTEVPFAFVVEALEGEQLYESYHGVYVNVCYVAQVDCIRGMLSKSLHKELEFIVEAPVLTEVDPASRAFDIVPEALENVKASSVSSIPRFRITGRLHRTNCGINLPFTGEIVIEESEAPIRSIELQLVRVEIVAHADGQAKEATEIQNIQLADGDVCRGLTIPVFMVFPRLFCCPTLAAHGYRVEFEINLVISFVDGFLITENFGIHLFRDE